MKYNIWLVCIWILSCSLNKQKDQLPISCIEGTNLFPKIDTSGKVSGYDTGIVRAYSYGNMRLLETTYFSHEYRPDRSFISEKRTHRIVFEKGSEYGYDYDDKRVPVRRKVKMDSVFNYEWITANRIYPIVARNLTKITSKIEDKDAGTLAVEYEILNKNDSSVMGYLKLLFCKNFAKNDFSLSKELDSVYNSKLCRSEIVALPQYAKERNSRMPGYTVINTLKEIPEFDKQSILQYFKESEK